MITPDRQEILRYLGYKKNQLPDAEAESCISRCLEELGAAAEPRSVCRCFPVTRTEGRLTIAGIPFFSRSLERHLASCREAVLFAATLGIGTDRLIARAQLRDLRDALVLQACAAAMIEATCDDIDRQIQAEAKSRNLQTKRRFSPGYGDLELSVQRDLCRVLDTERQIGLTLTESCMMVPVKSVTAIIGLYKEIEK